MLERKWGLNLLYLISSSLSLFITWPDFKAREKSAEREWASIPETTVTIPIHFQNPFPLQSYGYDYMPCCHAVLGAKNDFLESNKPRRSCRLRLREMREGKGETQTGKHLWEQKQTSKRDICTSTGSKWGPKHHLSIKGWSKSLFRI